MEDVEYPSRDSVRNKLLILIYEKGEIFYQLRSAETYRALADKFNLDEIARKRIRAEHYNDGKAEPVWNNMVQFARRALVDEGCLEKHAPHGIWRLTPKGVAEAQALLKIQERVRLSLERFRQATKTRNEAVKPRDTGS